MLEREKEMSVECWSQREKADEDRGKKGGEYI